MLGNIKDDEIQRRLDELRRDTNNNNNDNDDNINFNFDDSDDDDNDDDMDADDLLRKYDNLRRRRIPKPRPQKYEDELPHRYDRLKPKTDESDLLGKFDELKKLVFWDIPPSPPLKRKDYSDERKFSFARESIISTRTTTKTWYFANKFLLINNKFNRQGK